MKHYVLTRAVYGPAWDLEANARRLTITRAVTARLMAQQTTRDWVWVVALDPRDPLLEERRAVFKEAAPELRVILWSGNGGTPAEVASDAYRSVPWNDAMERDEVTLQTRLDDDDGLAPGSLERMRGRSRLRIGSRTIVMQTRGVRVWEGRAQVVRHLSNAMHTLVTDRGDSLTVYDYGHTDARKTAPVLHAGSHLAWLWVRHRDTLSDWKRASGPITAHIQRMFPVDWAALHESWR